MIAKGGLSTAVLISLFLCCPNLVTSQSLPEDEDRIDVVRTVLQAELARQVTTFENIRDISTENIPSLTSTRVAEDLQLNPISFSEITDKTYGRRGAHYLKFKDFKIESDRAVVQLSVIVEVAACWGPARKHQREFTYNLVKTDGYWTAELTRNPAPRFSFRTEKLIGNIL